MHDRKIRKLYQTYRTGGKKMKKKKKKRPIVISSSPRSISLIFAIDISFITPPSLTNGVGLVDRAIAKICDQFV